ncbi:hypothetical protein [Nitriliruptor alkaliphilus]|uniref:hypothetical protein n=1 Tax=Nitriliruptor alkaliphilus TaxID=427918 RepID=UPI0006962D94|nr:hypothetical protein [Nitriliruptor alkaliphilus]
MAEAPGTPRLAVAVLDGDRMAEPLAARSGHQVAATTPDDHGDVVRRLVSEGADLVVGVARTPWPQHTELHSSTAAAVAAYRGVVAWHGLPLLSEALAQAAVNGVQAGAHLLVTAPDPGPDATPEEVTFLREVAEQVAERTGATGRSIAWRGTTRTPTAVDALTSVLTVHGVRDVVEVPVAPGTPADPQMLAAAEAHGGRLTTIDLAASFVLEALTAVVTTVAQVELADGVTPGPIDDEVTP